MSAMKGKVLGERALLCPTPPSAVPPQPRALGVRAGSGAGVAGSPGAGDCAKSTISALVT
eukprot:scaffold214_cov121-Isochrysis_galbana.AAC.6